jgi:BASS family bile acid:Na+ symporter
MAVAGVVSMLTMPLSIYLLGHVLGRPVVTPAITIVKIMLMSIVVPLGLGLGVRAAWPAVADRLVKPIGLLAKVLLGIGGLGLLLGATGPMLTLVGNGTLLAMVSLLIVGLAVGHWLGAPEDRHRLALALSTASRHPAIALAVAKTNFPDEPQLGPAILLYLLLSVIVGVSYQGWFKRRAASPGA